MTRAPYADLDPKPEARKPPRAFAAAYSYLSPMFYNVLTIR